jgi:hypothetical protein
VQTPREGLEQQFTLSMRCYEGMRDARTAATQIRTLRTQVQSLRGRAGAGPLAEALAALDQKAAALEGPDAGGRGRRGGRGGRGEAGAGEASLGRAAGELGPLLRLLQGADVTPTTQAAAAVGATASVLDGLLARWAEIKAKDLPALNEQLRQAGLPVLNPERP